MTAFASNSIVPACAGVSAASFRAIGAPRRHAAVRLHPSAALPSAGGLRGSGSWRSAPAASPSTSWPRSGHAARPSRGSTPRGFTLTELLVVIGLVVLLVSLLLAALGQVQTKSRQTSTLATMQAFGNACQAFHQEHGEYPGVVPETKLSADPFPLISGTENALPHLLGGFLREEDVDGTTYGSFPGQEVAVGPNPRYKVKINLDCDAANADGNCLGAGPIINRKPYAPYFAPGDKEFGVVSGQAVEPQTAMPDLIDAWGQPIIYLRRQRSSGAITPRNGGRAQFDTGSMTPYLLSNGLGKLGRDQVFQSSDNPAGSILSTGDQDTTYWNLEKLLQHPALPGQARGAFMLLSAGADGVYFSAQDGPGSPEQDRQVIDVGERMNRDPGDDDYLPPGIFDEYDDVFTFGGS